MTSDPSTWPERVRALPRDERGYPIPYAAWQPNEPGASPDFRVLDQERVARCVANRLCGVCGQSLGHWIVFVGGPACAQTRLFNDPAMHPDCAAFATMACPFIAGPQTRYSAAPLPSGPGIVTAIDPSMADHVRRPETMYLFTTRRYASVFERGRLHIRSGPYAHVDEVQAGRRLAPRQAPVEVQS